MWVTSSIWRHAIFYVDPKVRHDCVFRICRHWVLEKIMVAWKHHFTLIIWLLDFRTRKV